MKITGTSTLESPVEQVWEAILDPAVLAVCIPGCTSLTTLGEDRYAMTVTAGVAAIKGTYDGEVSLGDKEEPSGLTLRARGAGAPGTVDADVKVRLVPAGDGTEVTYDANASVGGAIGGVGQRMLSGVTKKMAGEFFTALDQHIAGGGAAAPAPAVAPVAPVAAPAGVSGTPSVGTTFTGKAAAAPAATSTRDLVIAAVAGGLLALAGVALGARIGRRR
jgi:carbon monoxide dehydrogenase subunit G